jgi:hypothetical protein
LGEEVKRLKEFYSNTQDKNSEMGKVFSSVSQSLKEIESGLAASISDFSGRTGGIIEEFNKIGSLVSDNINKLVTTSSELSEQSKTNAALLIEQDEYVNKSLVGLKQIGSKISDVHKELKETGGNIGNTLTTYEEKMDGFQKSLTEYLNLLNENYGKTQKQYDDFNQKFKTAEIDTFMKTSSDIIAELEAISIDINGIFNQKGNDDELWKKYYEGDHSVFVRYLSKNMTKKEIVAIREDYENKPDFRVVVDKYLDDFAGLIETARSNNRAGTLLALISGSDVGKVYYILARALGKVN